MSFNPGVVSFNPGVVSFDTPGNVSFDNPGRIVQDSGDFISIYQMITMRDASLIAVKSIPSTRACLQTV